MSLNGVEASDRGGQPDFSEMVQRRGFLLAAFLAPALNLLKGLAKEKCAPAGRLCFYFRNTSPGRSPASRAE
ncbi:MAG: hypothetical protein CVU11_15180 [Bacteroidetes bacterium HGW-Bacteroidetes-6]|jgi:hypothetical protein|nr:MAG: hypothetical protein CVU11_15180 [Bacteroidetes bacterium HGW-Bacteroidetes-6]